MIPAALSAGASGLRPASAFVVIGCVLAAVAAKVMIAPLVGERGDPARVREELDPAPAYDIEDRAGHTLARFLEHYDVEMSPRSMWQAHTPLYMAEQLSEACGGQPSPDQLLAKMIPGAEGGVLRAKDLPLDAAQRNALKAYFARQQISGMWVETDAARGAYQLVWQPCVVLSEQQKLAHQYKRMNAWWQSLHKGLLEALYPAEFEALWSDEKAWKSRRDSVWNALMPSGYTVVLRDLPPETVLSIDQLLRREGVSPLQMKVRATRKRAYPQEHWAVLGDWGFLPGAEQTEMVARTGLERLCDSCLDDPRFDWIEGDRSFYRYVRDKAAGHRARPYYIEGRDGDLPARVRTTIDLELQRELRAELLGILERSQPASAMAIALDLESGAVLAVDGVSRYGLANFLPLHQRFTPGSTFKVVTMAVALESGAVVPDDSFEVGSGAYVLRVGNSRGRTIHEADGSLAKGRVSAAQCLAYSSNAGMAQIGTRVDGAYFHGKLLELGYGAKPGTGLGPEDAGTVYRLPWDKINTEASISFGHQIEVTLWQHATSLAAILRRGEWKPLHLLESVAQGGRRDAVVEGARPAEPRQVFHAHTSEQIRAMMVLGAREGTGRTLCAKRDDLWVGTKTGTAEKVPSELCQHTYGRAVQHAAQLGRGLTKAEYQALKTQGRAHGGSCYTSSILVLGRRVEGGPEVMVLLVVDDPTKGLHYGSQVAGPSAMKILDCALALQRRGEPVELAAFGAFATSELSASNAFEQPWREALR